MPHKRRNPGVGARGASDHVSTAAIGGIYKATLPADQHVATLQRNAYEDLRVALADFAGHRFLTLRARTREGNSFIATNGLTVPLDRLIEFGAVIEQAKTQARLMGWLS